MNIGKTIATIWAAMVYAMFAVVAFAQDDTAQDDTAFVQSAIDAPSPVTDFGGRTYSVDCLRLGPQHNGEIIRNIRIIARPGTSNSIIEIIKGRTWQGIDYPIAPVTVTFENVEIIGQLPWFEISEHAANESKKTGWFRNGIGCIVGPGVRIDSLTVRNCRVSGLGGSGVRIVANRFRVENLTCRNIAQHAVGGLCDGTGISSGIVRGLVADECGTAFDFASQDPTLSDRTTETHTVTVSNVRATNLRGRTKVAGPWAFTLRDAWFIQEYPITNVYPAITIVQARSVLIDGFRATGWLVAGIGSYNDPAQAKKPPVTIRNATVKDCFTVAVVQWPGWRVENLRAVGCWEMFRSIQPAELVEVYSAEPMPDFKSVDNYFAATLAIDQFNSTNGTAFPKHWWLPEVIAAKLASRIQN